MMQDPYDWEKAMETTRRSAAAASQNSEHAVAGMAKLLREIDRHSIKLASLTRAVEKLDEARPPQEQHRQVPVPSQRSCQLRVLGSLSIFAIGVAFGGYFMS
ncbi:hypothetical protein T8A63_12805 [Sulfitobacter sp. OXR-159]|uniref:hypothetical protein n=1 Tax=Sulfitobacter sp. OXR-159 TaxID=3100174 RepID=UPI002AC96BC6|nr:hypothetical protein [Sulfitobacter sp. OXR-159]WPZ28508.1 hypothetical protein T8A63_12805 [Sulfitobacter sp. OXR-159]